MDRCSDGNLYQIIFNLPDYLQGNLTDGEFITVELPIGADTTSGAFPFVPLDSVFQTQDSAYLYVVDEDKAASRTVTLARPWWSHHCRFNIFRNNHALFYTGCLLLVI